MSRPTFGNRKETVTAPWTFNEGATFNGPILGGNVGYKGQGSEFWLDPVSGDDGYDGKTPTTAKKTLGAAYALMTANKNDVLYFIGGATAISLSENFDWSKNFTHFVGITSATPFGKRARIAASANFTPMMTISARGCQFKNLNIQYGRGNSGNLIGVSCTYSGNAVLDFDGVAFEGPNHATEGAAAFKVVNLASGTQDVSFRNCYFGSFSAQANQSSGTLVYCAGDQARLLFDRCQFTANSTNAGMKPITWAGNFSSEGFCLIQDCAFTNATTGTTLTQAIGAPTNGRVLVLNSGCSGIGSWANGDTHVWVASGTTSVLAGGIGVNS